MGKFMNPITFIIGHRGCGKSSLLSRLVRYYGQGNDVNEKVREETSKKIPQKGTKNKNSKKENLCFLDLDREIEKGEGKSLLELWKDKGEDFFRGLEQQYLERWIQSVQQKENPAFIALGAGCDLKGLPEESTVLWLQRESDKQGRIFLDRPRLNPSLSPLEEFKERFDERQRAYEAKATQCLLIPEGLCKENPYERAFFLGKIQQCGGILTVQPSNFKVSSWPSFIETRKKWGLDFFELRDDLLNEKLMEKALSCLPKSQVLLSFRPKPLGSSPSSLPFSVSLSSFLGQQPKEKIEALLQEVGLWDWPIEGGPCPYKGKGFPPVLSLHERGERSLKSCFHWLEKERRSEKQHLKLAVPIHHFQELEEGHQWASQEPHRRHFLPSSDGGIWSWYRLRMKGHTESKEQKEPQKSNIELNFIKESYYGKGTVPDQPSLLQWLASPFNAKRFSAVLGSPVHHSHSPMEQGPFFQSLGEGFYAIDLGRKEVNKALPFLKKQGLHCAAVTSPLKESFAQQISFQSRATLKSGSVNTLWVHPSSGKIYGSNTDGYGWRSLLCETLEEFFGKIPSKQLQKQLQKPQMEQMQVALWGGGALLKTLLQGLSEVLPEAEVRCFSARTRAEKRLSKVSSSPISSSFRPSLLVWACGGWWEGLTFPPLEWCPQAVLDLNYSEDSPAKAYAQKRAIPYKSGHRFFICQGAMQRVFWKRLPSLLGNPKRKRGISLKLKSQN